MDPNLFDKAVSFARGVQDFSNLPGVNLKPGNDDLLKLYALYKQSTLGPCTGPRPSFFDVQGRYKYDAWRELGEMSRTQAMQSYVETALEHAMNLQAVLLDLQRTASNTTDVEQVKLLLGRISGLKHNCALLWPQRYAHLRVPGVEEIIDSNYEKEEEASYGQKDDTSFGSPLVLSDELRLPIPGTISSFLTGNGASMSGIPLRHVRASSVHPEDDEDELDTEEDPLHVKEPPPAADISTDSLSRGLPLTSKEFYELVSFVIRRLESLENSNRLTQQRLDHIKRKCSRTLGVALLVLKLFGGGTAVALLLYLVARFLKSNFFNLLRY